MPRIPRRPRTGRYISALTDTDKKISALLAETDAQAAEVGKNANAGYLGRVNTGIAALRKLKDGLLKDGVKDGLFARARAKVNDHKPDSASPPANPSPANLIGLSDSLKLRSIMVSAKPSAVIHNGTSSRYMSIGDTMRVQTAQGEVALRCERIEMTGVVLTEVKSGEQVQLLLK